MRDFLLHFTIGGLHLLNVTHAVGAIDDDDDVVTRSFGNFAKKVRKRPESLRAGCDRSQARQRATKMAMIAILMSIRR